MTTERALALLNRPRRGGTGSGPASGRAYSPAEAARLVGVLGLLLCGWDIRVSGRG